ncbi:MAG: type II toxin-antitoxin system PemK/MazF family toxin [Proteobacteria bacterium]|nr:type II toxin-antitoxin system PemK/MazF family toxin [Pseudomonadota bacterium]
MVKKSAKPLNAGCAKRKCRYTIPKNRLTKYIGTLDRDIMLEISRKVLLALEIEKCPDIKDT